MDSFGLVVHDEQNFLAKTVQFGLEQGIFTRDRADEIIRISVAMANKYVLHKEVDFRSTEELAKVQETILKLIGVGLEIKSGDDMEDGINFLMEVSPVDLFRIAHTRVEKLRHRWQQLLQNHRIEILVSPVEYESLSDIAHQRLSEMSIFTETEIHTIESLTLEDDLFSTLSLLDYYESELERYEFLLKLRKILPFTMLNRSRSVRAENLSEVDSLREALINTLVISMYVDSSDPVSLTTSNVRQFLGSLELTQNTDIFPEELEDVLVELIQELGEKLNDHDAALLTKEILRSARKLMETIIGDWETINSKSEGIFFKKWIRLAIISDVPDPIDRILSSEGSLDEFDFELLVDEFTRRSEDEAVELAQRLPWGRLLPDQTIRLFQEFDLYHGIFASKAQLVNFSAHELVDFVEEVTADVFEKLLPALRDAIAKRQFTLEDLELFGTLPESEASLLLRMAQPASDYDSSQILNRFREGSEILRQVIFYSSIHGDFFTDLFQEAWASDPNFVKKLVKSLSSSEIGPFLLAAAGQNPKLVKGSKKKAPDIQFGLKELNNLFRALPSIKKTAATKFFSSHFESEPAFD
ncbi:MAG: DUF6178 family protein [Desulfomonilaceae bacterium]